MPSVDNSHPYFPEVFEFSSMVVANMSLLMHAASTATIRKLVGFVNDMVNTRSVAVTGAVNDHSMVSSVRMQAAGSTEVVTLLQTDALFTYLVDATSIKPNSISYSTQSAPTGAVGSAPEPGRTQWTGADPTTRFELLTAYIIGGAFERRKDNIEARYGKDPSSWPPELQFFRHVRNGCFHSNTFSIRPFKGSPQIAPSNPPRWRSYTMPSDSALNGKKVIGSFFHVHQTVPFLDEMGKMV